MESQQEEAWASTGVQNLVRYVPSGTYYARFKAGGKAFRVSLKTTTFTVAKLRLGDKLKEARTRARQMAAAHEGRMKVRDALAIFRLHTQENSRLKPGTRKYKEETIGALERSWPGLFGMDVRQITEEDCLDWARRYGATKSGTRFNGTVTTLQHVLDIAVKKGACFANPARSIKRARVRFKQLKLPTLAQFRLFLAKMAEAKSRDSQACVEMVKFLAFTGCRKGEATLVQWADVDWDRNEIVVKGDPHTGTKNWEVRRIPVIPELRAFLEQWRSERAGELADATVLRVKECQKSMDRAAALVGMDRITHHDLRHFFATICIETGIDIPTVSRWLGHKDGGALAMRVYGHLRQEHSANAAKKIRFGLEAADSLDNRAET